MLDDMRLYLRYLGISIRSQMQYRASFIMLTIGHFFVTGTEFLGIAVLFSRFGTLKGWTLAEVAVLYGMISISLAISDAAATGFDRFGFMVKSGDFDRLLLRPRSTALQLAGQELTLRRIGRFAQGLIVLIWGLLAASVVLSLAKVILLVVAILSGACLFFGLIVLQATAAFWSTESLEIFNAVTYGGAETATFPMPIYRIWFRKFFTFIIPLACVNYFPALAILERSDPLHTPIHIQWLSPFAGGIFMIIALQIWKIGVRHYTSTGS